MIQQSICKSHLHLVQKLCFILLIYLELCALRLVYGAIVGYRLVRGRIMDIVRVVMHSANNGRFSS
jgi:hypothetical protein